MNQLTGDLGWLRKMTRFDLEFSAHRLARGQAHPGPNHIKEGLRALQYVQSTRTFVRVVRNTLSPAQRAEARAAQRTGDFWRPPMLVCGHSDASLANDSSRRSTTGGVVWVNGSPVAMLSRLQDRVTTSTHAAELIALNDVARDCLFVRNLINEIMPDSIIKPTPIFEDNQGTLINTKRYQLTKGLKHLDIKFMWVRELQLEKNLIDIRHLPTKEMIADIGTKALPKPAFVEFREGLGIVDIADLTQDMGKQARAAVYARLMLRLPSA